MQNRHLQLQLQNFTHKGLAYFGDLSVPFFPTKTSVHAPREMGWQPCCQPQTPTHFYSSFFWFSMRTLTVFLLLLSLHCPSILISLSCSIRPFRVCSSVYMCLCACVCVYTEFHRSCRSEVGAAWMVSKCVANFTVTTSMGLNVHVCTCVYVLCNPF